jgi:signal peptidase II
MGLDLATKAIAAQALGDGGMVSISERLAFLLVYNTGTAGGASIGPYTWMLNVSVTLLSLGMVLRIVKALAEVDPRSTVPLALVSGGALGNLASMLTGPEGVADFIAVQVTSTSTIVLNVADVWLWSGALLLGPVVVRLVGAVRAEQRSQRPA